MTAVAGLAQVAAVGVGIYTVVYTLVPLYKQAALEESVLRATQDLDQLRSERKSLQSAMMQASQELADTRSEMQIATSALQEKEAELGSAKAGVSKAQRDAAAAMAAAATAQPAASPSVGTAYL